MINDTTLAEARTMIAGFLKSRRMELGISQAALADITGLGIATIKRAEDARRGMNLRQLLVICDALNSRLSISAIAK